MSHSISDDFQCSLNIESLQIILLDFREFTPVDVSGNFFARITIADVVTDELSINPSMFAGENLMERVQVISSFASLCLISSDNNFVLLVFIPSG